MEKVKVLEKRIKTIENEFQKTVESYQTVVLSLEKQNEQQGNLALCLYQFQIYLFN